MNDKELKKEALKLEWERVNDFLEEIDLSRLPKGFLSCAHNTYYALFHAICALNIEYGLPAPSTHRGLLNTLYTNFVRTGILTDEDNKACVKAEDIRGKCDYDGKYKPSIEQLLNNFNNVKKVIDKIKILCQEHEQTEANSHTNNRLSVHRAELIAKSEAAFQKSVNQALSGKHQEKDHSVKPHH